MALANVAWILASCGKRILAVDWDLEAPGLHRYFLPWLPDKELTTSEGVIDFVRDFEVHALARGAQKELDTQNSSLIGQTKDSVNQSDDVDWYKPLADVSRFAVTLDIGFDEQGGYIDFVGAGRQGPSYSERVNSFDWKNFYERLGGGVFLEATKKAMRAQYDYVLIDSRTGVSDTAGICTVQMPDILVVCYTLNNQSIAGSAAVAAYVERQREQSKTDSKLQIFPVPMRVDNAETEKLYRRRELSKIKLSRFMVPLTEEQAMAYWGEVEVPYVPYYGYEEVLAAIYDKTGSPNSVLAPIERLCGYLTQGEVKTLGPSVTYDRRQILDLFEKEGDAKESLDDPAKERLFCAADKLFGRLSPDEKIAARRLLLEVVDVAGADALTSKALRAVEVKSLPSSERQIVQALIGGRMISEWRDRSTDKDYLQLVHEALLEWPSLQTWIKEDGQFLLWRKKLRTRLRQWELAPNSANLLKSAELSQALYWRTSRISELSRAEQEFIGRSAGEAISKPRYKAFLVCSTADLQLARILVPAVNRFAKNVLRKKATIVHESLEGVDDSSVRSEARRALCDSDFLILLASPEAAKSARIADEVADWLKEQPPEDLLIVLTSGEIKWDGFRNDFHWDATNPLPKTLSRLWRRAPDWTDLKWANRGKQLQETDARLRTKVAELTASLYRRRPEELFAKDADRRKLQSQIYLYGFIGLLLLLMLAAFFLLIQAKSLGSRNFNQAEADRTATEKLTEFNLLGKEIENSYRVYNTDPQLKALYDAYQKLKPPPQSRPPPQ
jgi:hypothetical protein